MIGTVAFYALFIFTTACVLTFNRTTLFVEESFYGKQLTDTLPAFENVVITQSHEKLTLSEPNATWLRITEADTAAISLSADMRKDFIDYAVVNDTLKININVTGKNFDKKCEVDLSLPTGVDINVRPGQLKNVDIRSQLAATVEICDIAQQRLRVSPSLTLCFNNCTIDSLDIDCGHAAERDNRNIYQPLCCVTRFNLCDIGALRYTVADSVSSITIAGYGGSNSPLRFNSIAIKGDLTAPANTQPAVSLNTIDATVSFDSLTVAPGLRTDIYGLFEGYYKIETR